MGILFLKREGVARFAWSRFTPLPIHMSNLSYLLRRLWLWLLLAFAAVLGLGMATYLVVAQQDYTIYDGETAVSLSGRYATVADVLAAANVSLRPEDIVTPALNAPAPIGLGIQIQRARAVTLRTENEGTRTLWTQQTRLGPFLAEAGVAVQRTDQIFASRRQVAYGELDETPLPTEVEIGRFLTVTIEDGANQQVLRTAAQTVGAALSEAGIQLYAADGVTPSLGSWLEPNLTITVQRSKPLTIHVDGRVIQTRSHHSNAHDVVAEAGIGLVGYDYIRPGSDTPLQANDVITVIRVTEDFRLEDRSIPYQSLFQPSDELEIDERAVISYGEPGILRQRIRIRYENGTPVSETVDGEWVAREPVNEVIGYGTRIEIRVVDTPEGPHEYWRLVRMRVTSYTAASSGKPLSHPTYGITASGVPAGTGVVAIDRSVVPFRSNVYVPGYGVGYAGDTGGGVRGRWIDLGYDEDEYVSWSGYVDVYYLTPVPPPDRINFIIPTSLP
jgi:resuscitation-promoting factor RpfB